MTTITEERRIQSVVSAVAFDCNKEDYNNDRHHGSDYQYNHGDVKVSDLVKKDAKWALSERREERIPDLLTVCSWQLTVPKKVLCRATNWIVVKAP